MAGWPALALFTCAAQRFLTTANTFHSSHPLMDERSQAMRLAAEQLRMVALGASPGNAATDIIKLRSCDGRWPDQQISTNLRRCSAAFSYQRHHDLRFHRRLPATAAPQRIAVGAVIRSCTTSIRREKCHPR